MKPPSKRQLQGRPRQIRELVSVGPATLRDLDALGIATLEDLARSDPEDLYRRLCALRGLPVDICCLDVFRCAVAQARDPGLPGHLRLWWSWSRLRKEGDLDGPA